MLPALVACALAGVALVLVGLAGPLFRVDLLSLPQALTLLQWAAYVGGAAIAAGLGLGVHAYRGGARRRAAVSGAAVAIGLMAAAIAIETRRRHENAPAIYDVTTDLENPPVFEAILPLRGEAPNRVDRLPRMPDQQRQFYPDVAPMTLEIPTDDAFNRALAAAQEAGWTIVTADRSSGRIEATATTRWFGFTDDIVVRLTPWGSGTRVDIRAAARAGETDAGRNARRIRRYLATLP